MAYIIFLINSIALGFGLAMDAFSVSLANGLNEPKMKSGRMSVIAGTFAGFQIGMPLLGWLCVKTIAKEFELFQKFVPWIGLILLLIIGGNMLKEGFREVKNDEEPAALAFIALLVQGVATSIDALSVGFTIANYAFTSALVSAIIIGITTFIVCFSGLEIGKKFDTKLSNKASMLGGLILIFIGIEIFIKGIFF